jgi:heme exporter protein B
MIYLRQVATVMAKDLRAELRTKEVINGSLSLALVVLLLLSFAFVRSQESTREIAGGLLWIVFAFASALLLNRSFTRELVNNCLDALIASPIPGSAVLRGKSFANFVLVMAVELVALPLFGIFYNVRCTSQFWQLMLVIVLGTWAMTVTGTIFSALTVNIGLREVMLPILNFPILIPALLAAMRLTSALVAGQPITADNEAWLKLLVGFDVMYTAVSVVLVETILVGYI